MQIKVKLNSKPYDYLYLFFQQAELADKEQLFEELSKKEEDIIKGLWSFDFSVLEQQFALVI